MDRQTKRELVTRLRFDAYRIATRFGLRYRAIEAERANVKRRYGVCYSDGEIRIRLTHVRTGRPLKYSSLVNTLCHELAHLKHFDHGQAFRAFHGQLLAFARSSGIYAPEAVARTRRTPRRPALPERPGPPAVPRERTRASARPCGARAGPEQLALFS